MQNEDGNPLATFSTFYLFLLYQFGFANNCKGQNNKQLNLIGDNQGLPVPGTKRGKRSKTCLTAYFYIQYIFLLHMPYAGKVVGILLQVVVEYAFCVDAIDTHTTRGMDYMCVVK